MRRLSIVLATGLYCGYIPLAPGTAGSLLGIPLLLVLTPLGQRSLMSSLFFLLVLSAAAAWSAHQAERHLNQPDSSKIVIDEVMGMVVAGFLIPLSWSNLAICFLLFRLFDIFKPPPVGWIDRKVKGGVGVVADDVAAGLYANLVMRLWLWF